MITVYFLSTAQDGSIINTSLQTQTGQSLMEAAIKGGIQGIAADCGGLLTCATCHVFVNEDWSSNIPKASDEELAMLEFTAISPQENSRLSCQILLTEKLDGLTVTLPSTQY